MSGSLSPSETRQNSAFRHQKGRNHPPCAHSLSEPFSLFPVRSPSLREKASLRSSAPCRGVEKLIFGEKKACLRHKTATRRLPRRRSRTVSGSLCQPSGRTAERPHGGRKNGKGGAQAFLQRCGQKKRRPPERDRRFPTEKRARRRPGPEGRGRNRAHRRGADLPFFPRAR